MQRAVRQLLSRNLGPWSQSSRGNVQLAAQPSAQVDIEWENARPYSEVPGPKPLPVLGNAWRLMPGIGTLPVHDFKIWMEHMYKNYGPISKITNIPGRRDLVFLFDPKHFEVVYRNEGVWPERLVLDSIPYYRNVTRKDFFEGVGGILSVNGEPWQKFRTLVNPVLMQPRNSSMYASRIDEVTNDFMSLIPGMLDDKNELPGHFTKELQKWALESISLIALDARIGCLKPNLTADSEPHKMINTADEIFELFFKLDIGFPLWKYVTTPSWRRYVKALDYFTEVCMTHINRAQEKLKTTHHEENEMSVLEKLLVKDPNPKKAVVMAIDMMLAGIDTTSFTAACIMYHLARNPEKQERLYKEVRRALPERDSPITADILESLKYLRACIKENNRMNPVAAGTGRRTPVDLVIGDYQIPKNTDMLMCHLLAANMDEHFPEAKSFVPERWLKGRETECPVHKPGEQTHPFTTMPFGFGKRNCVGMRFARLELETIIARMVRNYRMEWHHGEMRFKSAAVYEPIDPLKIRMFLR